MAMSYRESASMNGLPVKAVPLWRTAGRRRAVAAASAWRALLATLLLLSVTPLLPLAAAQAPAPSAPPAPSVPAAIRAALPEATLVGGGSYRWFGLKLYDARLWTGRKTIAPDNWEAMPLALELVYARTLYGERIAKASIDEIRQLGMGTPTQQAAWLDAMKRVFPDVKEGTQLVGLYQPGGATQFLRDGQPAGDIADPEFGKAFFSIWLHPKTSATKLRVALFGTKP